MRGKDELLFRNRTRQSYIYIDEIYYIDCPLHKLVTHNACIQCKALKDSPYHKDYLKNNTDDQIAEEIIEIEKEFED